jgi:hypothetical protein
MGSSARRPGEAIGVTRVRGHGKANGWPAFAFDSHRIDRSQQSCPASLRLAVAVFDRRYGGGSYPVASPVAMRDVG